MKLLQQIVSNGIGRGKSNGNVQTNILFTYIDSIFRVDTQLSNLTL